MAIQDVLNFVRQKAAEFGAVQTDRKKSYLERENVRDGANDVNRAYFGFIQPDEDPSGPYHDFSFTLMPGGDGQGWLATICVGSSGFKNDYELATYPGLRRLFMRLVDENGFCKSDLSDIESSLPESFANRPDLQHLSNTVNYYSKVFSVCQIIEDPESEEGKRRISALLAAYAKMRSWPTNQGHRKAVEKALGPFLQKPQSDPINEIKSLVSERKFVVLQGAPGTGKTRAAKEIAKDLGGKVFFTQFHAETSYSDFVYGIRPNLNNQELGFIDSRGILLEAIQHSIDNPDQNTILIIDEVNRANLSNVLGPVFYLFEPKMGDSEIELRLDPELSLSKLPKNFFVIATMNTADRSLAVVDFALRRRFAWYTLRPQPLSENFFQDDFAAIDEIFSWYATSDELSLQPGQAYFMAFSKEEMDNRIRYELFPLIKEYLQEGFLRSAKESFNSYFSNRINQSLYE